MTVWLVSHEEIIGQSNQISMIVSARSVMIKCFPSQCRRPLPYYGPSCGTCLTLTKYLLVVQFISHGHPSSLMEIKKNKKTGDKQCTNKKGTRTTHTIRQSTACLRQIYWSCILLFYYWTNLFSMESFQILYLHPKNGS